MSQSHQTAATASKCMVIVVLISRSKPTVMASERPCCLGAVAVKVFQVLLLVKYLSYNSIVITVHKVTWCSIYQYPWDGLFEYTVQYMRRLHIHACKC